VRKLARELGVDLGQVKGSGDCVAASCIADVEGFVEGGRTHLPHRPPASLLRHPQAAASAAFRPAAMAQGGFQPSSARPSETVPLARIKQDSRRRHPASRNWVNHPARDDSTDDADITELEAVPRANPNQDLEKSGVKLSSAAVRDEGGREAALQSASRSSTARCRSDGASAGARRTIWHIGFAADTPNGLVVPVVPRRRQEGHRARHRERDARSWPSSRATASSSRTRCRAAASRSARLGGIGGGYFTPIVNAPEVAIHGRVARA
jgi:pyruvate dehydrogenase E2 component (dihydrolipoamide acetyltransferase)